MTASAMAVNTQIPSQTPGMMMRGTTEFQLLQIADMFPVLHHTKQPIKSKMTASAVAVGAQIVRSHQGW